MNKHIALGTTVYLVAAVIFALAVQAVLDQLGLPGGWASRLAVDLVAVPAALWLGLRAGRITRTSLLLASAAMSVLAFAGIVYILDSIARPAGGSVTALSVAKQTGVGPLALNFLEGLLVPQAWLSVFRLAANNSSKPTPLRGAA
jgi:hypothetical protein